MAYSIEFQMLSKDAASKITTQVSKTSVMSFLFKNIVLKINHTESKMSDRKNLKLVETEQLAERVLMKKSKKKHKDKKVRGEDAWEKPRNLSRVCVLQRLNVNVH